MSTVLVLETNSVGNGIKAIQVAKKLGLRTHFVCRSPEEYAGHPIRPTDIVDEVDVVDTYDVAKLLRLVDGRTDYVAVLTYDDLRVVQASVVGHYLGLTHNPPPAAVVRTRFKDRLRQALAGTHWAIRYQVVPLTTVTSPIGYPCVVKPVDEAGSNGVSLCRDDADYARAMTVLRALTGKPTWRGNTPLETAIVEELLPGEEFSAELVWSTSKNDWELLGFTAKELSERSAAELGHRFPHGFPPALTERIDGEIKDCLRHLGLRDTVAHVEFRLSEENFSLIEVNPRPAGARLDDLVALTTGVGLVELHLAAHLGAADDLIRRMRPNGYAGMRFLLPDRQGTVRALHVDPAPDAHEVELRTVATPREIGMDINNGARLGYVIARGDSPAELTRTLDRHIARIRPEYAPAVDQAA